MFDVCLSQGESYLESKNYEPGKKIVISDLLWGNLGLSICYDLRFPNLYKKLAKKGADFFSIPAAFTFTTGKAHWHSLVDLGLLKMAVLFLHLHNVVYMIMGEEPMDIQ